MLFGNSKKVLTYNLSEPLEGIKSAKLDLYTGIGNLTVDKLPGGKQLLVNGELHYTENQEFPTRTLNVKSGHATLNLSAKGALQSVFRFPWQACNGATDWSIHLNPKVTSDITARSGGGNLKIDLAGMSIAGVAADTGGGNIDLVVPEKVNNIIVTAKTGGGNVTVEIGKGITGSNTIDAGSGAGNVTVTVPSGIAVKIHATSGFGKVIVDPQFSKGENNTYQSSDFEKAANKIEITAKSGAGNVSVTTK